MTTGRDKFRKNKLLIETCVTIIKVFPRFVRVFLWDLISPFSQIIFSGIRYIILKSLILKCGDNVRVGTNVTIISWGNLKIGTNVSIHNYCYIDATGGVTIGENVSIAHNCSILSAEHTWSEENTPIKYNKIRLEPVTIQNDVWIGCACRVLSGTIISCRCIIAAGAIVNKKCEPNNIYGGVPIKILKKI